MPFFSVIIPSFNRVEILPKTIATVLHQTFYDFELIVVDDGSTDGTSDWISECTDSRIQYVYQTNSGVSIARNTGVMISKGAYLVFLDSDDFVTKDWLKDFHLEIVAHRSKIVTCNRVLNGKSSTVNLAFLAGTFAIEKNLFKEIGMYDPVLKFGENTELKWRVEHSGYEVHHIQKANIFYNVTVAGAGKNRRNRLDFFLHVTEKHIVLFQKNKRLHQILTQVAGVDCYHLGLYATSRQILFNGYLIQPMNFKALLRTIWYTVKSLKKQVK